MKTKKNLSKLPNNSPIQVCQPVKDGFTEALKDSSKNFFSLCFNMIFLLFRFLLSKLG